MSKLTLTRGIPASGKTTWAKEEAKRTNSARINRDDLREFFGYPGVGNRQQEENVTYWQKALATKALNDGQDVIIDDTNLRAKYVKGWLKLAQELGAEVEFVDFEISLTEAIERDSDRQYNGGRGVGEDVIRSYFTRFTQSGALTPPPVLTEQPSSGATFPKYTPTIGLPHAVIFDIDGTLAHMVDRGPYDTSKYHTDEPDWIIRELARDLAYLGKQIVVMSGRDAAYRSVTINWLNNHDIPVDALFMRPEGDVRNDAIVKNELFETYVKDRWYVDFTVDDRNRVVDMWRAKGLTCLQVAPGDF